jgi:large subunit ribosomal protein L9
MEVILLERIEKLGQMGEVVKVKPGFARNYLLPQKKALRATKTNMEYFAKEKKQLEAVNLERRAEAEKVAESMKGLTVVIIRNSGDSGQLYGSVNSRDISDAISAAGFTVSREQVLIERPIKMLGLHAHRIRLHPEVSVEVIVNVAQSPDEAEAQQRIGHAIIPSESGDDDDQDDAGGFGFGESAADAAPFGNEASAAPADAEAEDDDENTAS